MKNLSSQENLFCSYYQAHVNRAKSWFVVSVFKSFDHMSFDRTIDKETSLFEFYVPKSAEKYFLEVMDYLIEHGYVCDLQKMPNRLKDPAQKL